MLTPEALLRLGDATDSPAPFDAEPFVLLDLAGFAGLAGASVAARAAAWISSRNVPVVGVLSGDGGPGVDHCVIAGACDATVTASEAQAIAARIRRAPLAAMTLVQVLRTTGQLPLSEALHVESLAYSMLLAGPEFARWRAGRARSRGVAAMNLGEPVLLSREGGVLEIRLNRPSRGNAISIEMRDSLVQAFELVAADASIERAVVRGSGRCFSTGGDLDEFGSAPDPVTAHGIRCVRLPARSLLACRDRIVFELHGACVGAGIELPAFGARVQAKHDAWFELPELDFGLIPGAGGCVSIPRRIGRQRTAELVLSGRRIDAQMALRWGLVDELID